MSVYSNDTAGKQAYFKELVNVESVEMAKRVKAKIQERFIQIWKGGMGLTPQEIFDAYGTGAAAVLSRQAVAVAFVQSVDSSYSPPTPALVGKTVTINGNGTVTVGDVE